MKGYLLALVRKKDFFKAIFVQDYSNSGMIETGQNFTHVSLWSANKLVQLRNDFYINKIWINDIV